MKAQTTTRRKCPRSSRTARRARARPPRTFSGLRAYLRRVTSSGGGPKPSGKPPIGSGCSIEALGAPTISARSVESKFDIPSSKRYARRFASAAASVGSGCGVRVKTNKRLRERPLILAGRSLTITTLAVLPSLLECDGARVLWRPARN